MKASWSDEGAGRSVSRRLANGVIIALVSLVGVAFAGTEVGSFTAPLLATLGGTGQTGYTQGDILHATDATHVGKLADVAVGQVLTSGGVGAVPAYSATPTVTSMTLSGNTAKGFLYSDASKGVTSTTGGADGEILIGATGAVPAKATISAGAGITVTNAANSITIVANGGGTRTILVKTANYSVVSGDSGTFFTTTGAAGSVNFTLPTAAAGLWYTFYVDATQTLQVTAGTSTFITMGGTTSASAGNVTDAVQGGCLTLVATDATHWKAQSYTMTWTVN